MLPTTYVPRMAAFNRPKAGLSSNDATWILTRFAMNKLKDLDLSVLPECHHGQEDPEWLEECGKELLLQLLGSALRSRRQQRPRKHQDHPEKTMPAPEDRTQQETKGDVGDNAGGDKITSE